MQQLMDVSAHVVEIGKDRLAIGRTIEFEFASYQSQRSLQFVGRSGQKLLLYPKASLQTPQRQVERLNQRHDLLWNVFHGQARLQIRGIDASGRGRYALQAPQHSIDRDEDDEGKRHHRSDRLHRRGKPDGRRIVLQECFIESVAARDQHVTRHVRADDRQHDDTQLQARSKPGRDVECMLRIDTRRQERVQVSVRGDQYLALRIEHLVEDILRKRLHDLLERVAQVDARRMILIVERHAFHDIPGHPGKVTVAQPARLEVREQRP